MVWDHQWKNVIWSEENKFNLDGPDDFVYYLHDLRKEKLVQSMKHTGGGSVMILTCFNFHGKSILAFLYGNQNQLEYQRHLTNHLFSFLKEYGGDNSIFQQDNCRCHVAKSTLQCLAEINIVYMPWPHIHHTLIR